MIQLFIQIDQTLGIIQYETLYFQTNSTNLYHAFNSIIICCYLYVNGLFQFDTRPILSDQNRFQTRFEGRIFHCSIHKCIKDIYIYLT